MISDNMTKLLNKQFNLEMQAHYKYLAISAYCELLSLDGFAHWFAMQSNEERGHALKIYRYLLDQDAAVRFDTISAVKSDFSSILNAFEAALENEQIVTKSINEITDEAMKERDHASMIFLQWFVSEQVEEEKNVRDVIERLKFVGDSGEGLLLIDRELASRSA